MVKARMGAALVAGWLLGAGAVPAWADPTVAQMLTIYKPRHEGVACSTPTPQEEGACKVEPVKKDKKTIGWLLRDPKGLALRRFVDSNDDSKIDLWSYYQDGAEVYRETDSNFNTKPDQFRWMNAGGSRWGIDDNEDGKIDSWKMISVEEVSQEVLQAVATRDVNRLRALMLSEAEIKLLGLPAAEASRLREAQKQALVKFQNTVAKLTNLSDKTHWLHVELMSPPQCLPAEQTGAKYDLVKCPGATILYETNGQNDWLQTGELIQVGAAWRVVDGPTPGPAAPAGPMGTEFVDNKELQPLLDELKKIDDEVGRAGSSPGPNVALAKLQQQRADVLEKIVAKVPREQRDIWIRQVADSLQAAAQSSPKEDRSAYQRLVRLVQQVTEGMPAGHSLAGYVTYREMQADYTNKLNESKSFEEVQQAWLDRLARFVQAYPRADDTPQALEQAGMVSEMLGKEAEAKKWYQILIQGHADKPQATKAAGAIKRLEIEGKPLELVAPVLGGSSTFDLARLQGKVVVVYCWASWNSQSLGDFARLKALLDAHSSKGVELVCVNLDSTAKEAADFVRKASAPGIHLFQPPDQATGAENPLAVQYGIMLPPSLFLVGKDGKVVSRTVQVSNLEEEVKKLLNK